MIDFEDRLYDSNDDDHERSSRLSKRKETNEQKEKGLRLDRERKRKTRKLETIEQKKSRLDCNRKSTVNRLSKETDEEYQARLERNRECTARARKRNKNTKPPPILEDPFGEMV